MKLFKWILRRYAQKGDKILDTHLGSGSIGIACANYGFELTASEIDPDYFAEAKKRIDAQLQKGRMDFEE